MCVGWYSEEVVTYPPLLNELSLGCHCKITCTKGTFEFKRLVQKYGPKISIQLFKVCINTSSCYSSIQSCS